MCKKIAAVLAAFSILLTLILSTVPFFFIAVVAVTTEQQLIDAINGNSTISLENDIQLTADWTTKDYSGTINGNGHVISGLTTTLIGSLTGNIYDLGIIVKENAVFGGDAILASTSTGTIQSCFVYGDIVYNGTNTVGGLVATLNGGSVTESFSCVNITSNGASHTGGLIGRMTAGTVNTCYSAGTIDATIGHVAGLSNVSGGTVYDTYTSCQLKNVSSKAKPSGTVKDTVVVSDNTYYNLYDNQLSILRESKDNKGCTTEELLTTTKLSDDFVVTSTAYPALKTFYDNHVWPISALRIIRVSTAAASIADADAENAPRFEPSTSDYTYIARMDYLTPQSYIKRTNVANMAWSISSTLCKMYDVVPSTAIQVMQDQTTAMSPDLLTAKCEFSANETDAVLTAKSLSFSRKWYLSSYTTNPYFDVNDQDNITNESGTQNDPFLIETYEQLDVVRYYSLISDAYYQLVNDLENAGGLYSFDGIEQFNGTFDGKNYVIKDIEIEDDGEAYLGLFATTQENAVIQNLGLDHIHVNTAKTTTTIGALVGNAISATIQNVVLMGTDNVITSAGIAGGLVGNADSCDMSELLVSVELQGGTNVGGIAGVMNNGTLQKSGVTGYIGNGTNVGGLVGEAKGNATVSDCYSTAVIACDAGTNIGGLIGDATNASLSNSYFAALLDAPNAENVDALAGIGTADNNCYYDKSVVGNSTLKNTTNGNGVLIADLVSQSGFDTNTWILTADYFPQLTCFAANTSTTVQSLSALSTLPAFFQNYWENTETEDMTTAWLRGTVVNSIAVSEPLVYEAFSEDLVTVYNELNGWGIEASAGSDKVAVYVTTADNSGKRIVAATRDRMIRLSYVVDDDMANKTVDTYLEIYYSNDQTNWVGSQIIVPSDGVNTPKVMYDLPVGSYVKVIVYSDDQYKTASLTFNNNAVKGDADNVYFSADAFDEDVVVAVSMTANTPKWGLRRQTYHKETN